MNIFIWRDNEEYGPLSRSEIFACLARGEFDTDVLARIEGEEEWRPLGEVLLTAPSLDLPTDPTETPGVTEPAGEPQSIDFSQVFESAEQPAEDTGFNEPPADEVPIQPEASIEPVPLDAAAGSEDMGGVVIWRNNELFGPYSWDDVFAQFFRGELSNGDRARREGEEQWHSLGDLLLAETGMEFPDIEETTGQLRAVAAPPSRRPLIDFSNTRTVLVAGAVGMLLGFAATCLVIKARQAPDIAAASAPIPAAASAAPAAPAVPADSPALAVAQQPAGEQPAPASVAEAAAPAALQVAAGVAPPAAAPKLAAAVAPLVLVASTKTAVEPPKPAPKPKPSQPPATLAVKVRQIKLLGTARGDFATLWVADTVDKPRGILALCISRSSPDRLVQDPVWQKFASDNQLALAAVSFVSDKKLLKAGGSYLQVDQGSGNLLLTGLDIGIAKSLPIIMYGQGAGGTYAASFAAWQPHRVLLWAAYTNDWRVDAPAAAPAPAVLVCDQEDAKGIAHGEQLFAQGRLLDNPWTWLPVKTTWNIRGAQVDDYVRNYLGGALSPGGVIPAAGGVWADIGLKRQMSPAECLAQRDKASWSPNSQTFHQWLGLMNASDDVSEPTIIEKDIATKCPSQPTVKLYLRLPPGVTNGSAVSGVLAYCTWENNEAAIVSKLSSSTVGKPGAAAALVVPFLRFAEQHNLAVLTWGTDDVWSNSVSTEELARKKQEQFDHNFDLLADAWARGVGDLSRETGIPQNDILLYGISRGAQWAHRLALRKPDYFLAVHVHIPSTFDTPTPEASKPLWLLTTGEQEYGYERAQQFYHECCALGYPIIFKAIVGLGHADTASEHALGFKFFEYALSLRDARDAWLQAVNDPIANLKSGGVPAATWLAPFRAPAFYGDFLNQDCYPANQIDMIPEALRVPLPTKELADLWNK